MHICHRNRSWNSATSVLAEFVDSLDIFLLEAILKPRLDDFEEHLNHVYDSWWIEVDDMIKIYCTSLRGLLLIESRRAEVRSGESRSGTRSIRIRISSWSSGWTDWRSHSFVKFEDPGLTSAASPLLTVWLYCLMLLFIPCYSTRLPNS